MSKLSKFMGGGSNPVGSVHAFAGVSTEPEWIPLLGQRLLIDAYPELYAVVNGKPKMEAPSSLSYETVYPSRYLMSLGAWSNYQDTTNHLRGIMRIKADSSSNYRFIYAPYGGESEEVISSSVSHPLVYNDLSSLQSVYGSAAVSKLRIFSGFNSGPWATFGDSSYTLWRPLPEGYVEVLSIRSLLQDQDEDFTGTIYALSIAQGMDKGVAIVGSRVEGAPRLFISFDIDFSSNDPEENFIRVTGKFNYPYATNPSSNRLMSLPDASGYYVHTRGKIVNSTDPHMGLHRVHEGQLLPVTPSIVPHASLYSLLGVVKVKGELYAISAYKSSQTYEIYVHDLTTLSPSKTYRFDAKTYSGVSTADYSLAHFLPLPGFYDRFVYVYAGDPYHTIRVTIESTDEHGISRINPEIYPGNAIPTLANNKSDFPYIYCSVSMSSLYMEWKELEFDAGEIAEPDEFTLPLSQPHRGLINHVKAY